jgi:hypothetical protein
MTKLIIVLPLYHKENNPESIQGRRLKHGLEARGVSVEVIDENSVQNKLGKLHFRILKLVEYTLLLLKRLSLVFIRDFLILNEPYSLYNGIYTKLVESRLTKYPDAVLLTSSTPFSIHEVGLRIHNAFGNKWIIRMSDPFLDNPYNSAKIKYIKRLQYLKESRYFSSANAITVTSDNYLKILRNTHNLYAKKFHLIYHSMTSQTSFNRKNVDLEANELIKGAFIGNIYGRRNPYYLFLAIKKDFELLIKNNVQFHFYGKIQRRFIILVKLLGLDDLVYYCGSVKHSQIVELMNKYDFFINIESSDSPNPFFPSKLTDYLSFNKPILNLATTDSISREFINIEEFSANPINTFEIIDSIRFIVNNPNIRLSYPTEILSIDKIVDKYFMLIERLRDL